MDRVLYWDLIGGAAGDMLLASLIDVGASIDRVLAAVRAMNLDAVEIKSEVGRSAGLRARRIDVMIRGVLADQEMPGVEHSHSHDHDHDHAHAHEHDRGHRSYRDIRALLQGAAIGATAKRLALEAFRRLAEAEADAHGVAVEDVVFHEVGADDAIADIVGVATAIEELSPRTVVVSPVPIARGLTRGAHGPIPLPGPAALRILVGAPLAETPLRGEMVTPTGAALIATLATRFGPIPSMIVDAIGVGAGHREWPDRPNVVRALLGRSTGEVVSESTDDCVVEANIDDMNPQHLGALERALFTSGAFDVWSVPVHMKKGRIGVVVAALGPRSVRDALAAAFFTHSSTLGVRVALVTRLRVERRVLEVGTEYGVVKVKIAPRGEGPELILPEHDDCERLAAEARVPVRVVWEAALQAARRETLASHLTDLEPR